MDLPNREVQDCPNMSSMSADLCPKGNQLFDLACSADHVFKTQLVNLFSSPIKHGDQMHELEQLGADQRDADEAFHRHQKHCEICSMARTATAGSLTR